MEKRKPHYVLEEIKKAFAGPDHLNRTVTAKDGADDLGMDDTDVVSVVQGLTISDFDKSMTSHFNHKIWQDVYKPVVGDRTIYVKFTLDSQ